MTRRTQKKVISTRSISRNCSRLAADKNGRFRKKKAGKKKKGKRQSGRLRELGLIGTR